MGPRGHGTEEGSIAEQVTVLGRPFPAKRVLFRPHRPEQCHSQPSQVAEAQSITEVVCVQNHYNLA